MSKRLLYDLAARDESIRFSPYCWRTKLALAHKNLSFETVAWHFTDKDAIAFSNQGNVPVLVDGETVIADSHEIAEYLETAYPNEASLFGDAAARALISFCEGLDRGRAASRHRAARGAAISGRRSTRRTRTISARRGSARLGRKLEDFAPERESLSGRPQEDPGAAAQNAEGAELSRRRCPQLCRPYRVRRAAMGADHLAGAAAR